MILIGTQRFPMVRSFRFLQVPIGPIRSLQIPSGPFRFLQASKKFTESLAAFRLKDFQSCFSLFYALAFDLCKGHSKFLIKIRQITSHIDVLTISIQNLEQFVAISSTQYYPCALCLVPNPVTPCTRLCHTLYQTLIHLVPDFVIPCTSSCHTL